VAVGLLECGAGRFAVTSGGLTGHCSSVFSGPNGDTGNAPDGQQARQLAELGHGALWRYTEGPDFDTPCNSKCDSRRMCLWGLVGLGIACIGGAVVVFWPTKSGATQPK
jgi:hypothetical protein